MRAGQNQRAMTLIAPFNVLSIIFTKQITIGPRLRLSFFLLIFLSGTTIRVNGHFFKLDADSSHVRNANSEYCADMYTLII